MYSFITPRKKRSIDSFTYMWIAFITLASVLLIGVGLYLDSENRKFDMYKTRYQKQLNEAKDLKKSYINEITELKYIYKVSQESRLANKNFKNGLQNLLLFIPDEIEINKMYLDKYEVKLFGITDSPKTYKLLLEPPLKSIFDSSRVGFTKREDGRYLFSSYNKVKRVKNEK